MAGQKPAGRRSGSTRQSSTRQPPVRPGSPTARSASAGKGQASGKRQGSTPKAAGTGKRAGALPASAAWTPAGSDSGKSGPAGRSAAVGGKAAAGGKATGLPAAAQPADGPADRLLRAAWSQFRSLGAVPIATFILSLYGLGASIYLTLAHYDTSITLACSDKGLINCAEVTTSPESMVFGIFPVAVLGLAFYLFMVAVNSPWGWRLSSPAVRWLRLGSVIAGMGFVLYLIYAEVDLIHAICLWCTSVHVATFLLFALLVFYTAFSWEKPAAAESRAS